MRALRITLITSLAVGATLVFAPRLQPADAGPRGEAHACSELASDPPFVCPICGGGFDDYSALIQALTRIKVRTILSFAA